MTVRLLAAAMAVTGALAAPAFAQDTVKIGIVTATSGPLAAPGSFQLNGFKLAAEEINAKGLQVGGKTYKIELQVYDTRGNAAEGSSAMQRLATVDKVPVVLGEVSSPVALAESVIAQDFGVPIIFTVPTSPTVTEKGNPFVFRVNAHGDQLNKSMADYVIDHNLSPLGYIAFNNDTGRTGVKGMTELVGDKIKQGYVGYFNVGDVDYSAHVANLRSSGTKAVMLLMDEEPGSLAIKQIRDSGLDIKLIGTLAMGSDRFLKRLDAEKLAGMTQYTSFPPNADLPAIKNFSDKYRKKYGEEAHAFAAQSYDGLYVAVEAMKKAGTVTDGKKLRDALAGIEYKGVIGTIKFDTKGQASPPTFITEWCKDGTRKILAPAEAAAGCGKG